MAIASSGRTITTADRLGSFTVVGTIRGSGTLVFKLFYLSLSLACGVFEADQNKILIFELELARLPHVEPIGGDAWEFRNVREVMKLQKHCEAIELFDICISQSGTFEISDCPTQRNGQIWHWICDHLSVCLTLGYLGLLFSSFRFLSLICSQ